MLTVMDYKILYELHAQTLQADVKNHIKNGWVPQGGIARGEGMWAQAMVKPPAKTDNLDY